MKISDDIGINKKYKDRLFRLVFGAEENKKHLLSLYNALNNTHYENENDIQITTLEDAIYMHMKNDISFIIAFNMDLFEHQSTFNPNMPLRGFMYFGHLYDKYLHMTKQDVYGKKLVKIPTPEYIVFYNGTNEYSDKIELKLSDAFINKKDGSKFEWTATMLNINADHNKELMDKCTVLKEYSDFVQLIRDYSQSMPLEQAIDQAVKAAGKWQCLGNFLQQHRSEVVSVVLMEYDEKLHEDTCFEEGFEEGHAKGIEENTISNIISVTKSLKCSLEQAMDILNIPPGKQAEYSDIIKEKLAL